MTHRPGCDADSRTFRPSARLRQPKEFAVVLASRSRSRMGCFEVRHRPNEGHGQARLGLVIPKRMAKQAVLRNLIKRLARESFRHLAKGLPAVDVVLRLAGPALPGDGGAAARREMPRDLWRRQIDALFAGIASGRAS